MTNQLNEKPPPRVQTTFTYFRTADGSWNVLPIAVGVLLVVSAGYLLWSDAFPGRGQFEGPAVEKAIK